MPSQAAAVIVHQPEVEGKRDKFVRVAGGRVKRILKAIDILARLGGNASDYDFDATDIDKICERLRGEVDSLKDRMTPPRKRPQIDFEF